MVTMKVLEFITRYSKRFLGIGLVAVLTMVQLTAGASTTVQDSIRSRGYITYDPDLDGSPDMAFYSEDLVRIGAGVDSLNDNISELTTKYDELASTSDMYRTNIIDALNTNVYKNSNLPGTTSFLEIISAVQNIPSPTTASGAYYGSGDNNTLGVGISDTNTPVDVPVENVYSLDLGISEQITLPAGYYGDPITIRNGVANRGTIAKTLESSETYSLPEGYYESIIIQAPTVASAIQFSNNLNFTISKNFSGSWYNGNHSEEYYYNYTVPQTGLLVYSFASKGGTYDENPKYIRTWGEMTCSVESGSFVHQGDVITFGIFRKYSGSSTEYAPDAGGTITVFLMY